MDSQNDALLNLAFSVSEAPSREVRSLSNGVYLTWLASRKKRETRKQNIQLFELHPFFAVDLKGYPKLKKFLCKLLEDLILLNTLAHKKNNLSEWAGALERRFHNCELLLIVK